MSIDSTHSRAQRGSAMVLAVFVLALLTMVGAALLFLSQNEMKMSQAHLNAKKAFYLAEAAVEDGRLTLFDTNGNGLFDDDLEDAGGADDTIDFSPDALNAVFDADGNVTGIAGFDDDVPLRALTPLGEGFYAAFLTNDPVEGEQTTNDGDDSVMITGIGVGPDRSVEIAQAIIGKESIFPVPQAAITLLGPAPAFDGGSSDSLSYSGDDCGVPGGVAVPVVGTIGAAAELAAEAGVVLTSCCPNRSGPDYSSDTYSGLDTVVDLTDSSEPLTADMGTADATLTDCKALQERVEEIRARATHTCCTPPNCDPADPNPCGFPPGAPDNVIFIDGDWDMAGDGAGLLLVTGELRMNGIDSWSGMLMVVGKGHYERNGSGNGVTTGSILVADIAGPDEIYGTADDCTGGDGGFGSVVYDQNGGGNAAVTYCTADFMAVMPTTYVITDFLQR